VSIKIDEDPLEELSEIDSFPGERSRQITNLFVHAVLLLVMIATVAVLAWVLVYVAGKGLKYLGPEFLTQTPPGNPSQPGGGFLNGIIGSLIVTSIATLLSMPVGIAAAIYLVEYGAAGFPRVREVERRRGAGPSASTPWRFGSGRTRRRPDDCLS
jgi:phosphate transport system permease protein